MARRLPTEMTSRPARNSRTLRGERIGPTTNEFQVIQPP
jgi:hypothetical protein